MISVPGADPTVALLIVATVGDFALAAGPACLVDGFGPGVLIDGNERNRTCRVCPDALVTGARPVSASDTSAMGNRLRSSPISVIRAGATTGPIPVKEGTVP
jgi:hypothetical protein